MQAHPVGRQVAAGPIGVWIDWTLDNDFASVPGDFLWSRRGPGDRWPAGLVQWAETGRSRTLQLPLSCASVPLGHGARPACSGADGATVATAFESRSSSFFARQGTTSHRSEKNFRLAL